MNDEEYHDTPKPKSFACQYVGGPNAALNATYWTPGSTSRLNHVFGNTWASLSNYQQLSVSAHVKSNKLRRNWLLVDLQGTYVIKQILLGRSANENNTELLGSYLLVGNSIPEVMDPSPPVEAFLNIGYLLCMKIQTKFLSTVEDYHKIIGLTCSKCYLVGKYVLLFSETDTLKLSGFAVMGIPVPKKGWP